AKAPVADCGIGDPGLQSHEAAWVAVAASARLLLREPELLHVEAHGPCPAIEGHDDVPLRRRAAHRDLPGIGTALRPDVDVVEPLAGEAELRGLQRELAEQQIGGTARRSRLAAGVARRRHIPLADG